MNMPNLRLFDGYDHTNPSFRPYVKQLQELLNNCGLRVEPDGFFGFNTQNAVITFQKLRDLKQDAVVGPKTWASLKGTHNTHTASDIVFYDTIYIPDHAMLNKEYQASIKYLPYIVEAANDALCAVEIIWGIGSRESGWGTSPYYKNDTGDYVPRKSIKEWRKSSMPPDGCGFGRGLMQIDYDAHEFARTGFWRDPKENILYGGDVLAKNIRYFKSRVHNGVGLRAAIAAYNCGTGNVIRAIDNGKDIDYYTAGRDYSSNVLSRAGWFQRKVRDTPHDPRI